MCWIVIAISMWFANPHCICTENLSTRGIHWDKRPHRIADGIRHPITRTQKCQPHPIPRKKCERPMSSMLRQTAGPLSQRPTAFRQSKVPTTAIVASPTLPIVTMIVAPVAATIMPIVIVLGAIVELADPCRRRRSCEGSPPRCGVCRQCSATT